MVVVTSKSKPKRICVDYRKLNSVTITENWPLPNILDILEVLAMSKYFTILDLKSGYWQVLIDEESIEKTAFSTPDGHYEFLRLPFGLKNAPAHFCRIMSTLLGDLNFVAIYLDDITIHSKSLDDHFSHINIVLNRLQDANLKLNPSKCTWIATEIKILGHIVANNKIAMDKDKIKAIVERAPPKNVKQLQQFLGLVGFYRRFIDHFSLIVVPLFALLKLNAKFVWDSSCDKAFEQLKKALVAYPILRQPDSSRPFVLYTDASGYALGAILGQFDGNDEYVCAYASRILNKHEVNYSIAEKECLAILFGLKNFRVYLLGTHFNIITDHSALKWLMSIKEPTGRLARWAIYLQGYSFDITHRKGLTTVMSTH